MAKYDDMWIVAIGIVFISIVIVLLLAPKSYFKCQEESFASSDRESMSLYLNRSNSPNFNSIAKFDAVFNNGFQDPSSLPTSFRDGSSLLIARRCYQFTKLDSCKFEDPKKVATCKNAFAKSRLNIGSTIDDVMRYFDKVAAGPKQYKMSTYKLMSKSFDDIRNTVVRDIEKTKDSLGQPIKGSAYVMLFQVPYWRSAQDEFISVQFNAHTRGPYFDAIKIDPKQSQDGQLDKVNTKGEIFTYMVIFYGGYIGNTLQDYDWMDGTKLTSTTSRRTTAPFIRSLDRHYASKDERCLLRCNGASDVYCGCASSPFLPSNRADNIKSGFPANAVTSRIKSAYAPNESKGIFGGFTEFKTKEDKTIDPTSGLYQARCNGTEIPMMYSEIHKLPPSKMETPSTFGVLYRVNPASTTLGKPQLFDATKNLAFYDPTAEDEELDSTNVFGGVSE
jgi:hypothetical protein